MKRVLSFLHVLSLFGFVMAITRALVFGAGLVGLCAPTGDATGSPAGRVVGGGETSPWPRLHGSTVANDPINLKLCCYM